VKLEKFRINQFISKFSSKSSLIGSPSFASYALSDGMITTPVHTLVDVAIAIHSTNK
jgi:hypothetical protein